MLKVMSLGPYEIISRWEMDMALLTIFISIGSLIRYIVITTTSRTMFKNVLRIGGMIRPFGG